jgi:hypothetical protein
MLPASLKFNSLQKLLETLDKNLYPDLLEDLKKNPIETMRGITLKLSEADYDEYEPKTVKQLRESVQHDERLADLIRYDPALFLKKMVKEPLPPQFRMYRMLIGCLCTALILIISGALAGWFIKNSKTPPDSLIAMAATIIGVLVGMFISVPGKATATAKP